MYKLYNEKEQEMVKLFVQNHGLSSHAIASMSGESVASASKLLHILYQGGLVDVNTAITGPFYVPNIGTNFLNNYFTRGITTRFVSWPDDYTRTALMALNMQLLEMWQNGRTDYGVKKLIDRILSHARDGYVEMTLSAEDLAILCMALSKLADMLPKSVRLGRAHPILIQSDLY